MTLILSERMPHSVHSTAVPESSAGFQRLLALMAAMACRLQDDLKPILLRRMKEVRLCGVFVHLSDLNVAP